MKKLFSAALCALATLVLSVAQGETFFLLRHDAWTNFGDSSGWGVGTTTEATNPQGLVPGEGDYLFCYQSAGAGTYGWSYYFDLTATEDHPSTVWTIKGFEFADGNGGNYNPSWMVLRNGTLRFSETFTNTWVKVRVTNGAKFEVLDTASSRLGRAGCGNVYDVQSGGELYLGGELHLRNVLLTNASGATTTVKPAALYFDYDATSAVTEVADRFVSNSGTLFLPNGFLIGAPINAAPSFDYRKTPPVFKIYQRAGTMTVAGDIGTTDTNGGSVYFELAGGTLVVNETINFKKTAGQMPADATAEIQIADGKSVDLSNFTFEDNTTLTITGAGTVVLGDRYPATLNLGESVKLGFCSDVDLDTKTITGLETAEFAIATPIGLPRVFTVRATAASVRAKIEAIVLPEGWTKTVSAEGFTFAAPPEVFVWLSSASIRQYDNPAHWSVGAVENVNNNPNLWIPGPQDQLLYGTGSVYKKLYLDLNGKSFRLGGIAGDGANWNEHGMSVENGTLEIVNNFSNYNYRAEIKAGGKFVLGLNSFSRLGYSGAINSYTIRSDGEVDFLGSIEINNSKVTIDNGGTLLFDPVFFAYDREAYDAASFGDRGIVNSGTVNAPHGIAVHGSDNPTRQAQNSPMVYTLQNLAGATINLGGDIEYTGGTGRFRLDVQGGVVNVTDDVKFEALDYANFANAVEINVADGKTFDLSSASFGGASTVSVNGAIKLGVNQPTTLTLAAGSKVSFMAPETTLGVINGTADASFAYEGSITQGQALLKSADDTLLSAIFAKLPARAGWSFVKRDGAILAVADEPDPSEVVCFQSVGEMSLADDQGSWNTQGGVVPESGDVFVSGSDTIAVLDAQTVTYDSITVMRGATLKISGAVETLPAITLYYGARLLFAEDAAVSLVNPIAGVATEDQLPVMELAAGAVVTAADGYEFKNLHLKNFGRLKFSGAAYIGTADVGESALFQLTSEGGVFDFLGGSKEVRWMGPKTAGGRVHVVGKVAFKDSEIYASNYKSFRCSVSRDNPADEVYDFELDNTRLLLETSTSEVFGGGVKFKCLNGGRIEKAAASTSPGVYGEPHFNVASQATFDGETSRFLYFYNRFKVYFSSFGIAEETKEVMTFKNGAYLHLMNFQGSPKDVIGFEDGFWDITELPGYDPAYWNNVDGKGKSVPREEIYTYLVAPFTGFNSVRIGTGKTLGIRSYSVNELTKDAKGEITEDRRWNRTMKLANVPVTGENGSMYVVNATKEQSLEVTLTCGENTATGELWAEPSEYGCKLLLASGANWAGTLVASETIGFTNLVDAAAPATVTVGNVRFDGRLPIRVWKGAAPAADQLVILGSLAKIKGGFAPVEANGAKFEAGDTFTVGTIPAANLPAEYERAFTSASWRMVAEGDGDTKTLKLVYAPQGVILLLK